MGQSADVQYVQRITQAAYTCDGAVAREQVSLCRQEERGIARLPLPSASRALTGKVRFYALLLCHDIQVEAQYYVAQGHNSTALTWKAVQDNTGLTQAVERAHGQE